MARMVRTKVTKIKLLVEIDKILRSYTFLNEVASFVRTRIYQNTKRGYYAGVRKNLAKLKPLSSRYIEWRKSLLRNQIKVARGRTTSPKRARTRALRKFGPFFSPSKSNLTLTGQLLESMDSMVSGNKVIVFIPSSKRYDSTLTNSEVAKKVADDGRPFLALDDTGIDRIRRSIISNLRRSLKGR